MVPIWLQIPLAVALAILAWISGMDTMGNPMETWLLWAAAVFVGGHLAMRLVARAR
jgi:hypothetical protein